MMLATRVRELSKLCGISPKQLIVVVAGAGFGAGALVCSELGWRLGRDAGIVGLLFAVLVTLVLVLRAISFKTLSIRRDLLRLGQRQAAASQRIEASTGLSVPSTLGSSNGAEDPTLGNSLGHSGKYFGIGPEYEYAWRAAQNLASFETFALRTKSLSMRDVFARVATGLQFNYKDILRIARTAQAVRLDNLKEVTVRWRPKGLLTLARVVANQRILPNDAATSVLLFELAIRVFGLASLGRTDQRLYLEALVDEGRGRDATKRIKEFQLTGKDPIQSALLTANLARPTDADSGDWGGWVNKVNRVLALDDASPILLSDGVGSPLDRIAAANSSTTATRLRNRAPLVSVIMPTHNGSDLIDTALRSLQAQTWQNIEIIVVDDFSSPSHVEKLKMICAGYDNVTLLELKVNSGAYVARNAAIPHAKGELITVHDDDDWSHPEKLERQASALVDNPENFANMSQHTRVTENLSFLRINNNTSFTQPNYSSIMFRRSSLPLIGEWDTVNRGADAEFRDRIRNVTGKQVDIIGNTPMSFTRTRVGSLTHGELDRGYIEPARLIYLDSYTQAHKKGVTGCGGDERNFAAPLDMLPKWRAKHKGKFDVVYATDFRFPGGTTSLTIGEIRAAVGLGLRVGVLQLDSPLNKPGTEFSPALLNILLGQQASLLRLRDVYDASLLIVRHPSVAQFLDNLYSSAQIQKCILIANTAPVIAGGAGSVYDLEDCVANIASCFNVNTTVVPESGVTRKLVGEVAGGAKLASYDWPGFIDIKPLASRRVSARMPVVGRHSRDSRLKWPDSLQDFMAAYCQPDVFSTHILGGIDSIAKSVPSSAMNGLTITPFGGANVRDYLLGLDFWVYFHSSRTIESFGMAAAEAMEAGLVVVLPDYMSSTFGDGAVYAKPSEVSSVIKRFWNDPTLYESQSRRARSYVQNHYSSDVYAERLTNAISEGRSIALDLLEPARG